MIKRWYLVTVSVAFGTVISFLVTGHRVSSQMNEQIHHGAGSPLMSSAPTLPGQDAFGAIQEIVKILESDPATDWSQVNLLALREHLIDMNEVTLNAAVEERKIDDGLQVDITGVGRTQKAIQRLVVNQAQQLNQFNDWEATTAPLPEGIRLTVTSAATLQVKRIKALGFVGLLVSGGHHQQHHLAIARGLPMH
jgi:hypothetical protein